MECRAPHNGQMLAELEGCRRPRAGGGSARTSTAHRWDSGCSKGPLGSLLGVSQGRGEEECRGL